MIMGLLFTAAFLIFMYLLMAFVHEIGHAAVYRIVGGKNQPQYTFKLSDLCTRLDWSDINRKKQMWVAFGGVWIGLIPLVPILDVIYWPYLIILVTGYFIGCRSDFRLLGRLYRLESTAPACPRCGSEMWIGKYLCHCSQCNYKQVNK
jgi:hypothetical protein